MNYRRKLLLALGAAALASPVTPLAQPVTKVARIGFLSLRNIDFVDTDYCYAFLLLNSLRSPPPGGAQVERN